MPTREGMDRAVLFSELDVGGERTSALPGTARVKNINPHSNADLSLRAEFIMLPTPRPGSGFPEANNSLERANKGIESERMF
jgi:hypothetical protein